MGGQTNCDLTRYVKKEANHVGPTLEARFYTLEMLTFDVSRQLAEQGEACLLHRLPRPWVRWLAGRGEACLLLLIVLYWFIGPHCILCQILTID